MPNENDDPAGVYQERQNGREPGDGFSNESVAETVQHYNDNADQFFAATVDVDMGPLRARFLARVAAGGRVLDAGCGSGRDAKQFLQAGYQVEAFDASVSLAEMASAHSGLAVEVLTFQQYERPAIYDGIWACASLLHLPRAQLQAALLALWRSLKPGGSLYVSFKSGDGERVSHDRHFTDVSEAQLSGCLTDLPASIHAQTWPSQDQRPGREEVWVNGLVSKENFAAGKLVTGRDDPFLPHLCRAIGRASEIDFSVAFVKSSGLRLLLPDLQAALTLDASGGRQAQRVRLLVSDYLDVTDPDACRLLMLLQDLGAQVRVYETAGSSFHMKAYLFAFFDGKVGSSGTAFIGSSNISRQALSHGLEWNYRVDYPGERGYHEARQRFDELFVDARTLPLSHQWIDSYEKRRVQLLLAVEPGSNEQEAPPEPTSIQLRALEALAESRAEGFRRGLVVLATGLGKTWLAAFDSLFMGAKRVLFVAHRAEILQQAAQTFVRIRPRSHVSLYRNKAIDVDAEVLCASVQTLGRTSHLDRFAADHFDYIVVDEFHHAAAPTYRRLLAHFKPRYLLGLTATPDRSDQSDILSLCDDKLVFTCGLFDGIRADLLVPFHYYGIFDEGVNYKEVPWRNGRFDATVLSNKLATLGRARHALAQWRAHKQACTLAFCVSIQHADFMAEQFRRAGVLAAAVYGGSELGRADALQQLRNGQLQVLFSVDLFNEGLDLPGIDTVLMLRPTESKILFLQQLGRGLRKAVGKDKLVVLDFIGNHHSFFHKPQALCNVGSSFQQLALFARDVEAQRLSLPEGCYVNFDLALIDFLKSLDSGGVEQEYQALKQGLGRRPTAAEFYRAGASMQQLRRQFGSWFELLARCNDLTEVEAQALLRHAAFLKEMAVTNMSKSYKMVLIEAFLELDGWRKTPSLQVLASASWQVLQRRRSLLRDLPAAMRTASDEEPPSWKGYWRGNPVAAWFGETRRTPAKTFFKLNGDEFQAADPVNEELLATFGAMVQELVDYRLASYDVGQPAQVRQADPGQATATILPFPARAQRGTVLPFFPNLKIACGHFRTGTADAEEYRNVSAGHGQLDPDRHFIARAAGHSMDGGKHPIRDGDYLLLERLSASRAGAITGTVMAIEKQDDSGDNQYVLRVVLKLPDGGYALRANNPDYRDMDASDDMRTLAKLKSVLDPMSLASGQNFERPEIAALFGETFNVGKWNVGHVVLHEQKVHVLMITLNKQGKAEDHRYLDHWVDEQTFHWQTQNATTPESAKGRSLIQHAREGWRIYLFVREGKLASGKAAPFTCFGSVSYQSHSGSAPMSVLLSLN